MLLEKEQILQYELTKSRAQALGLERISEDFKSEMDRFRGENLQLRNQTRDLARQFEIAEAKARVLETTNQEISQREKKSQNELAKNRERLSAVEKSYADFKLKINDSPSGSEEKNDVEDI